MYFGNQKVNIEVAVSVKAENPFEATIKLNAEGTAFLKKYAANINKIQPDKHFTQEQALSLLILNGFGNAFTVGHLQSKDVTEIKGD